MTLGELADEIKVDKEKVIEYLNQNGFECKSSRKTVSDEYVTKVKEHFAHKTSAPAPAPKKADSAASTGDGKKIIQVSNYVIGGNNVKKKSSNIIITGSKVANNQQRGNAPANKPVNNANRTQNTQIINNGPASRIRPLTKPSSTPEVHFVPQNANKSTDKSHKNVENKPVNQTPAENAVNIEKNNVNNTTVNENVKTDNAVKENSAARNNDKFAKNDFKSKDNKVNRDNKEHSFDKNRQDRFRNNDNNKDFSKNKSFGNGNGKSFGNDRFNKDNNFKKDSKGFDKDRFNKDKDSDSKDNNFNKKQNNNRIIMSDGPSIDLKKNSRKDKGRDKDKDRRDFEEDANVRKGKNGKKVGAFVKPETKVVETVEEDIKVIVLPEVLTIKELADKMKLQPAVIVKKLFMQGEIVTVNSEISYEKAEEIAIDYDIICEKEVKVNVIEELLKEEAEDESLMSERPPVVCVMGHVDHGKTSLLDAIRSTHVIEREAGGITQAIGAYMVECNGKKITFLDTPGHEAFTAMRMRGANATDIAILVVAADDGVMPQTVEAINHAKAAGTQIIVAVNKVDKIGYDFNNPTKKMDTYPQINNLMRELAQDHELLSEDWGGTTIFAPVSAKKGEGINELLDMILLSSEMLELKANPKRRARGLVIEAELDKGRGPVATVLVQKGTLKVGDFVSAGEAHGKVRAMIDDTGRRLKEAPPSTPVEILGLDNVPNAGEIFIAHSNDKEAKSFADTFIAQNKVKLLEETKSKMSLDELFTQIQAGNLKELNIIVKADVQGSVEAVKQSLEKLSNEEVVVKVIHGGVGAINESDVILASAAKAIIIGFNVRLDNMAKETVEREAVDVRLYSVIYQAIEDVEAAMKGMLDPVFEEKVIGHAEVRQIFKASAIGNIAGSYVLDGMFKRDCLIRITRGGEQIYEGKLASLKRFKDDVKEVKAGYECGLVFEEFDRMEELDLVEAYEMVEVPR